MKMAWAHFKKRTGWYYLYQSLNWDPQGNRKLGRPKSIWKIELQNELIKEINKTLSVASTVSASKEKWKVDYALLRENGNDDEV